MADQIAIAGRAPKRKVRIGVPTAPATPAIQVMKNSIRAMTPAVMPDRRTLRHSVRVSNTRPSAATNAAAATGWGGR